MVVGHAPACGTIAQGAVFTNNLARAYRFVEELATGQVVVNDSTCWWDINMPFGDTGGITP